MGFLLAQNIVFALAAVSGPVWKWKRLPVAGRLLAGDHRAFL
jgi:hypothetical protein